MGKIKELMGNTREMKCGVSGTIIWVSEDRKSIDVEFENGVIMRNKSIISFRGRALNPLNTRMGLCKEGDIFTSNQGCVFVITQVYTHLKILIEFQDEYKYQKFVTHHDIIKNSIFNPYNKSVHGFGYLGMEIPKSTDLLYKKCYSSWHGMIERCYSEKIKIKHTTYRDCISSESWLNYSEFKKWFDENYYEIDNEKMCLDKDILIKNNKLYSGETCIFVPNTINTLFTKTNKFRGNCPIGVYYNKKLNKYVAQCSEIQPNGKKAQTYLGLFHNKEDAFYVYKRYKEKVIKEVADKYKEVIPNKLHEALYKWEVEIDD